MTIFQESSQKLDKIRSQDIGKVECPVVETQAHEVSLPHLMDKVTDIAIANQNAGLIISASIGTSIIIHVICRSAVKLVTALGKQKL